MWVVATYKVQQYLGTVLAEETRSKAALDRKRPDGNGGRRNVRVTVRFWRPLLNSTLLDHKPLQPLESRSDFFHRCIICRAGTWAIGLNKA